MWKHLKEKKTSNGKLLGESFVPNYKTDNLESEVMRAEGYDGFAQGLYIKVSVIKGIWKGGGGKVLERKGKTVLRCTSFAFEMISTELRIIITVKIIKTFKISICSSDIKSKWCWLSVVVLFHFAFSLNFPFLPARLPSPFYIRFHFDFPSFKKKIFLLLHLKRRYNGHMSRFRHRGNWLHKLDFGSLM